MRQASASIQHERDGREGSQQAEYGREGRFKDPLFRSE